MDVEQIEAKLEALGATVGRPLRLYAEVASTNDEARRAAAEGAPHGAAFLADTQTAGRGRQGHRWHSPPGENIYLSVVLRPSVSAQRMAPLTLAIGVAVARCVDVALREPRTRIKWPNDVYVDDRKIAGVLVEATTMGSATTVVAGVGLNVLTSAFPPPLDQTATSLVLAGCDALEREQVVAELLAAIGELSKTFSASGIASLAGELSRRDLLLGRSLSAGDIHGRGAGIDADGCLRVQSSDGTLHTVRSGEVIWRS
jgi:BirA family biotin operon repressor/biotin-[acetyl-CoA-carboxylase] ligase